MPSLKQDFIDWRARRKEYALDNPQSFLETQVPEPPDVTSIGSLSEDAMDALAESVRSAAATEEERFNNLNNRALSLLSAAALVAALAGLFSNNLGPALGWAQLYVATSLVLSMLLLIMTAALIVFMVLMPANRLNFSSKQILEDPSSLAGRREISAEVYKQYWSIQRRLRLRNADKSFGLKYAYLVFWTTIVVISLGVVLTAFALA